MNNHIRIIKCDIINPVSDTKAELLRDSAVVMTDNSKSGNQSAYVFNETGRADTILKKYRTKPDIEIIDRSDKLMLPPFFDIHFHWVQDDVREMPKENLLSWLQNHVWPYEAKFKDAEYSDQKCMKFAEKLVSSGTLGGAVYCSIHSHTVDHALKYFKGKFIAGNVLMTMNSPEYLTQSEENAINIVKEKTKQYREKYAVTPRFAPTTSPEVMKKSATYASEYNSFIQTHLSETKKEIEIVLSFFRNYEEFENIETYTDIYKKCGILSSRTIMGHCIHLSDYELAILAETGTSIAHCPSSNAPVTDLGLGSGLFDFRRTEEAGIKWGLASDIGGGPFLSMFDVMRSFVQQNREKNIIEADYTKALYRSTAAGAQILGIEKSHGSLDIGKNADFILVDSPIKRENESAEIVLKQIIESRSMHREKYSDTVKYTFLNGEEIFRR